MESSRQMLLFNILCGTNAQHQSSIAERAIQTVSNIASAMLLHTSVDWEDGVEADLCPRAVNYKTYIYNHTPKNGFAQLISFWRCSTFPSSQRFARLGISSLCSWPKVYGMFVGLSLAHVNNVPLVLNSSLVLYQHNFIWSFMTFTTFLRLEGKMSNYQTTRNNFVLTTPLLC